MVNAQWVYVYILSFLYSVHAECSSTSPVSAPTRRRRESTTCVLPPYPEHGKWEVLGGCGKPGETVLTNTLIIFKCDPQYKLNTVSPYVICNTEWNINNSMPTCEKLCPAIYSTLTTTVSCKDKDGRKKECDEATDGTYLSYTCAPYYEPPLGFKRVIFCFNGEWSSSKPVCQPVCGKKVNTDVLPIIAGGTTVKTVEFPWVIALYRKKTEEQFVYICGGTIISRRVILTAAHCVADDYGSPLPQNNFQVAAAKLYSPYKDTRDPKAQYLDVHTIIVNSQYKGESRRFLGDLAIVVTKDMFVLSPLVQPACFNGVNDISLQVGHFGEVAGWGNTETNELSDQMKFLQIPYKYDDVCERELPREWSDKYNILDKMCAGFRNESKSVCKGDSGSGLVFKNSEDNRFYVHGVASLAPAGPEGKCNVQQNALYTKVAFYYEFIDRWVAVYHEDDCRLPPYPENGVYFVENRANGKPGDMALSTEIIKIQCNAGYTLNSPVAKITCESSGVMPKCEPQITTTTSKTISGTTPKPKPIVLSPTEPLDYKVICSYASWAWYSKVKPDDLNVNLCSHMYYAFVGISYTGALRVDDEHLDIQKGGYRMITDLKNKKPNLKVLLTLGGNTGTNHSLFLNLAKSEEKTSVFIESATHFMTTYNFDGINVDWHAPKKADKDHYINFLKRVRKAFNKRGWLLTAAVSSDLDNTGYDPPKMNEILDWVTLKTMDMYGSWSKYTGEHSALYPLWSENDWEKKHLNVHGEVKNWLAAGLRKDKLVISIAFYARTFKLKDKNEHGLRVPIKSTGMLGSGVLKYSQICSEYKNFTGVWNDEQKSSYSYKGTDWFSYDTKDAIWIKGAYVKEKQLAGVNVWSVDNDDVFGKCGTKFELLKHLHGGLGHSVNWEE